MAHKPAAMAPDPEPGHPTATRRLSRGMADIGTSSLPTDLGHEIPQSCYPACSPPPCPTRIRAQTVFRVRCPCASGE
jgi:hypothetical protein